MRRIPHLPYLLTLFTVFILLAAFPISASAAAGTSAPRRDTAISPPHQSANRDGGHVFPLLRWIRDSAVEIVFGRPASSGRGGARGGRNPGSVRQYGGAARARYSNDVVVRFNVTSLEEEAALEDAAGRLFLDVWAFTDDYVDVRLHKDDVASLMTLLPSSLHPAVLIPDVAAAVWATYPSYSSGKETLGLDWVDPATIRPSAEGVDNIFFRDYQPLSVSHRNSGTWFIRIAGMLTLGPGHLKLAASS